MINCLWLFMHAARTRLRLCARKRREQQRRQNGDDRNDHQKFDKRETHARGKRFNACRILDG